MLEIAELPPPERGKHDKAARRRALIDAAVAVFAEHGYDAATTRQVAHRAGCAEGLIHRYFGGKRGLLLAVLDDKAHDLVGQFRDSLPDRDSLEEELRQIMLLQLEIIRERCNFMRVGVSQSIIDPEVGRAVSEGLNRQRVLFLLEKLRRHQGAGRIRPDVDLEALAQALAGLVFSLGFFGQVVFQMDPRDVRRYALSAVDTLVRGVAPPPA